MIQSPISCNSRTKLSLTALAPICVAQNRRKAAANRPADLRRLGVAFCRQQQRQESQPDGHHRHEGAVRAVPGTQSRDLTQMRQPSEIRRDPSGRSPYGRQRKSQIRPFTNQPAGPKAAASGNRKQFRVASGWVHGPGRPTDTLDDRQGRPVRPRAHRSASTISTVFQTSTIGPASEVVGSRRTAVFGPLTHRQAPIAYASYRAVRRA